jgi:hypothetical protein
MAPTYSKAEFIKYITDKHPILDILQHTHTSHFLPNSAFIDVKPSLSGDIKPYLRVSIHASIQPFHIIDEPYPHMKYFQHHYPDNDPYFTHLPT